MSISRQCRVAVATLGALICLSYVERVEAATNRVTQGIVALYDFAQGSGSTVPDVSGVGAPLDLLIQDPDAVKWLPGGGLAVTASTVIASAGVASNIVSACKATGAFTLEAWIRPADTNTGAPGRLFALSDAATNLDLSLSQDADRYVSRQRTTSTGNGGGSALSAQGDARPRATHVVVTRTPAGDVTFFINGVSSAGTVIGGSLANWSSGFRLALVNEATGGSPWRGQLHLVAVYSRALTTDEIQQNYRIGPRPPQPFIVDEPSDVELIEPDPATFAVTALGSDPIWYEWQREGQTIPSATDPSYTLAPTAAADDGAHFYVRVSNPYGVCTSRVAVLTVHPYVPHPPHIDVQPSSVRVTEPTPAVFTVVAAGDQPIGYQWRRDGTNVAGQTSTAYIVDPTVSSRDSGAQIDVVVSNPFGAVTSLVATLTVDVYVPRPPHIDAQPLSATVPELAPVEFSVAASGDAPIAYQWRRNQGILSGATNPVFTIDQTDYFADNGAGFDVIVSNPFGSVTSLTAVLTVIPINVPPSIDQQPADMTVMEPGRAQFWVTASGAAPLYYQWRRNGTNIFGASMAGYVMDPTSSQRDNGSKIDVVIVNAFGSVTSRVATLTVLPYVPAPPRIITEPADASVTEPQPTSFSVFADGEPPLRYQWRRNGANISGAVDSFYTINPTAASRDNGAKLDVVVLNDYGSVTSRTATLTVESLPLPQPPSIDVHPADASVNEPDGAGFSVMAKGESPLHYQWRRNGTNIFGATISAYALDRTTAADNGARFDVVVSNAYGRATSHAATLTVTPLPPPRPPEIVAQPADVTVTAPDGAGFSVLAGGDEPLLYRWRRNGTNIAGAAISAYALDRTAAGDAGARFDVVVSNAYGSVTSRTATLTVLIPNLYAPQIRPLAGRSILYGSLLAFTVSASDADGTVPALSAPARPATAQFTDNHNGTGAFQWRPQAMGDLGDHTLRFAASDGQYSVTNEMNVQVRSFTVSAPAANARILLGKTLKVGWSGLWPLGSAVIDLWRGTNLVRVLAANAPAAASNSTWQGTMPPSLAPGSGYWISVIDASLPDDYSYSGLFTAVRRKFLNDFDGDGKSDLGVFDNNTGNWYVRTVAGQVPVWGIPWGWPGAVPVPGDYDNDGKSDLGVFDNNTGNWYIRTVAGQLLAWGIPWGWPGAIPVPGDYDGDGKSDLAVFDSNTGNWYIRTVAGQTLAWGIPWGWPGAVPVAGDYDGDGKNDLGVFDNNTGNWYVRTVAGPVLVWSIPWGWPGANPVAGDYDGDGKSDLMVFDTNTGKWYGRTVAGQALVWGVGWGWPGAKSIASD